MNVADVRELLRLPEADVLFNRLQEQRTAALRTLLELTRNPASTIENIRHAAGKLDGIELSINTLRNLRGDH